MHRLPLQQTIGDRTQWLFLLILEHRIVAEILHAHRAGGVDEHHDRNKRAIVLLDIGELDDLVLIEKAQWKAELVAVRKGTNRVRGIFITRYPDHLQSSRPKVFLNFAEDTESCDALVALRRKNDDDEFFTEKLAEIDPLSVGGL